MTECFAVASGSYSDYSIHCVFEREEDANEYTRLWNLRNAREYHALYGRKTEQSESHWVIRERAKHQGEFDDCEACRERINDSYFSMYVERFGFHAAGEIPHGDAA